MFFDNIGRFGDAPAVYHPGGVLSYRALEEQVRQFRQQLGDKRRLVFLQLKNDLNSLVAYLACLQSGHCVALLADDMSADKLDVLIKRYEPDLLINEGLLTELTGSERPVAEECAILLSTSGSTGTAKQVALSHANLHNNADAICRYLPIQDDDRALMTLPMHYSYGLSVINSHLLKGAALVLTPFTPVNREWWVLIEELLVSSISGVPHSYEILLRLRFTSKALPHLRYFTQAGGRLSENHILLLAEYARENKKQFFVMYGQTEATARMAYLAPHKVCDKPGSIGQAIPGGELQLYSDNGEKITSAGIEGELVYTGPNVMLGYVESSEGLKAFEPLRMLRTGDIAVRDEDGDFYIKGRKKRFLKIFGQRLGLDEVEALLKTNGIESYCCGNDTKLVVAVEARHDATALRKSLAGWLQIHPSAIAIHNVEELPINSNGKKDYQAIMTLAGLS